MKNVCQNDFLWCKKMKDRNGYFYHRKFKNRIDITPYIRWEQAWMLNALTRLTHLMLK